MNLLGVLGGIIALVSIVLPWVNFFGIVGENLISFIPDALGSTPLDRVMVFGALFAIIFVVMGGFISLVNPAGGIASILGGAIFLATVPYFQGVGPVVALIGGLVAISGFFFPGLTQTLLTGGGSTLAANLVREPRLDEPSQEPAPSAQPSSMFCPSCGERYPGDYKVCPRDASELKALHAR